MNLTSKNKFFLLILFFCIGIIACATELTQQPKIFQIGFNRCGTISLNHFFTKNNIKSIHWDCGALARSIQQNYLEGLPLLGPEYKDIIAFFDMEYLFEKIYIGQQLFKELDSQYPGSKFILNTRDKKKWLRSRVSHRNEGYLKDSAQIYGLTLTEMFSQWSWQWDQHHAEVLEYFKDRPEDLLVFDIEKDSASKLCDFFKLYYKLDPNHFLHIHKSSPLSTELERLFEQLWSKEG